MMELIIKSNVLIVINIFQLRFKMFHNNIFDE